MSVNTTKRQTLANRYLRAADIGTVCLVYLIGFSLIYYRGDEFVGEPIWPFLPLLVMLPALMWSIAYMFFRRKTDEFTLAMWHSGVTVAFFVVIAWSVFGIMVESTIEGYLQGDSNEEVSFGIVDNWDSEIILLGYYAGFHFKRFTGGM